MSAEFAKTTRKLRPRFRTIFQTQASSQRLLEKMATRRKASMAYFKTTLFFYCEGFCPRYMSNIASSAWIYFEAVDLPHLRKICGKFDFCNDLSHEGVH